jgi:hypothetical protein
VGRIRKKRKNKEKCMNGVMFLTEGRRVCEGWHLELCPE